MALSQRKQIDDLLKKFSMEDCKLVTTPMEMLQWKSHDVGDKGPKLDASYQNMIRHLMYLVQRTCPGTAFTVHHLSQLNNVFSEWHWKMVKCYLKGPKTQKTLIALVETT